MSFIRLVIDALFGPPRNPDVSGYEDELKQPLPGEDSNLQLHVDACTRRYTALWNGLKANLREQARVVASQRVLTFLILLILFVEIFDFDLTQFNPFA